MTTQRMVLLGGLVVLFIFAKAWIFTHPKSSIGLLVGAFLLILSEPAEAK